MKTASEIALEITTPSAPPAQEPSWIEDAEQSRVTGKSVVQIQTERAALTKSADQQPAALIAASAKVEQAEAALATAQAEEQQAVALSTKWDSLIATVSRLKGERATAEHRFDSLIVNEAEAISHIAERAGSSFELPNYLPAVIRELEASTTASRIKPLVLSIIDQRIETATAELKKFAKANKLEHLL